jgi:hypothetical protein
MKISDVRKGMRVQLAHGVPVGLARSGVGNGGTPRIHGTVLSPKPIASRPPYEENLTVRVQWDGFRTPEHWSLVDLEPTPDESVRALLATP